MNDAGAATPYDEVLYPSYTHTYSHPDRLATQALLWGMSPAPVTACRVLELGGGDGTNIIPMAYGLPESRFLGIDLSARAVARGQGMISDLGLQNVELRHADIMSIDASWGEFDYIIAHGVFSWVPPDVREKIFALCRTNLAPQGVAFISYLAYPGSYVRAMLRDMMLYRAGGTTDAEKILSAGREMAAFIESSGPDGDLVRRALHGEAARVLKSNPDFLFHDDLAEWSAPYYFVQFAGMAATHGLQFLAEADPAEMMDFHLLPDAREELARLAPRRLEREQYLDFVKARRFRQTLLCRSEVPVSDDNEMADLRGMLVASPAEGPKESFDLALDAEVIFRSPRGPKLDISMPMGKAALAFLVEAWPRRIPFLEIIAVVRARLTESGLPVPEAEEMEAGLTQFFHHLNSTGFVEFHTEPTPQVTTLSDRPLASAVARWQAMRGNRITTLRHVGFTFADEPIIRLIPLLDGTRSLEEVTSLMLSPAPPAEGRSLTESDVMIRLRRLALEGMLIG